MPFLGDIFGGGSAPKVSTKGVAKSFSTPFYSLKKGNLTASPAAASPSAFGGIRTGLAGNQFDIMGLRAGLNPIRNAIGGVSSNLSSLYGELRPGFGRLTEARVKTIRDAAAAAVGDLRTQLQQRSVLGSSFGNDAETRTKLAFAQEEEKARSEAIIEEIGMSKEILQQQIATQALALGISEEDRAILAQSATNYVAQANTLAQEITTELNQLQVAGNITNQVSSILMEGAMLQAKLDMQAQTQFAQTMGVIAGTALKGGFGGFG